MSKRFDDILAECLDRITVKGDSVEKCLGNYPEHAAELEPLLKAAVSLVGTSSAIKPSPEFERVGKHRLLAALEAKGRKQKEQRTPFWTWQRRWAVALAVLLVLILAGGSTVTASASSLPGDVLYPVKTATEKVQGFFTWGSEDKAGFHIKLAQRRLDELDLLVEKKRNIPQSLLDVMQAETDRAIEILNRDKPLRQALVVKLVGLTSRQNAALGKMIEKASPQAKWKLREALRHSEHAYGRAISLRKGLPELKRLRETIRQGEVAIGLFPGNNYNPFQIGVFSTLA